MSGSGANGMLADVWEIEEDGVVAAILVDGNHDSEGLLIVGGRDGDGVWLVHAIGTSGARSLTEMGIPSTARLTTAVRPLRGMKTRTRGLGTYPWF